MKFIYVFSEEDKNRLIKAGFKLLKDNPDSSTYPVYIFDMNDKLNFSFSDIKFVGSDTLTF